MIDCKQVEELLPLHAVDDTSLPEAMKVEEHLADCGKCREALDVYRLICRTAGEELAEAPPSPEFDFPAPARGRPFLPRGLTALAAALLILLAGVAVGRWTAGPLPAPGTGTARTSTQDEAEPAEEAGETLRRIERRGPAISVFSPAVRATLSRVARPEVHGGG